MNEELYHLLDGELPDAATVELLRNLAEDGEQRIAFRQQMQLQGALYRNGAHASLTSGEEGEMLARVSNAVGVNGMRPRGGAFWGGLAAVCLFVGAGLGYTASEIFLPAAHLAAVAAPVVVLVPTNQLDSVRVIDLNRDTVAEGQDSVAQVKSGSSAKRRTAVRQKAKRRGGGDDPTGRKAALHYMNNRRAK